MVFEGNQEFAWIKSELVFVMLGCVCLFKMLEVIHLRVWSCFDSFDVNAYVQSRELISCV